MKSTRIQKGDSITHKGKTMTIAQAVTVKFSDASDVQKENEPVIGEHQSDSQKEIFRAEVLNLLDKQIDKMEVHEATTLIGGAFRDEELEGAEYPFELQATTAAYATNAVVIAELKKLHQTIQKMQ